jgi:hypothetical protein
MVSSVTSIKPIENSKETLLGMTTALEQRFGCQPRNDLGTTLNTKFGVFPSLLPTNPKLVRYFCWGVGGKINDTTGLSSAQPPLGTDMAPYAIRPFRAVPFDSDLSAPEMAQYAMRQVVPNFQGTGVTYCLYYLKLIDFTSSQVQYVRQDPVTGNSVTYEIDDSNLSPTPPAVSDNGVITDVADSVSVILPGNCILTGQEVLESMAVMDGGDPRYAIASEMGFVSASTQSVSVVDNNGVPFSYNEAILAQMTDHYTCVGQPFFSTDDTWTRSIAFSLRNIVVSS